jgi:hypothetical protein
LRGKYLLEVLISLLIISLVLGQCLTVVFQALEDHLVPLPFPLAEVPEHHHLLLLVAPLRQIYRPEEFLLPPLLLRHLVSDLLMIRVLDPFDHDPDQYAPPGDIRDYVCAIHAPLPREMRPHGSEGLPEAFIECVVVQPVKDLGGGHPMHLLINLLH